MLSLKLHNNRFFPDFQFKTICRINYFKSDYFFPLKICLCNILNELNLVIFFPRFSNEFVDAETGKNNLV
jgi:hypothetical protein